MNKDNKKTTAVQAVVSEEIVPVNNQIVNFDPEQDIAQGQKAAKALMQVIEITKPLKLNGKTYLYFEHWQTIAKFFGMTVGIEWTKKTDTGWEAKSTVYKNGVVIGGAEASCNKDEANWKLKPDFQLKSMAQTRAAGKGLRNILGYIPVLAGLEGTPAEEMDNVPVKSVEPLKTANLTSSEPLQTPDKEIPATNKQIGFILALIDKTGAKGITQDQVYKLSISGAKKVIEQLKALPVSKPEATNFDEPPFESSVEKARRILNAKVPKAGPYNFPEGD